jgi:hypothetical protein
MIVGEKIPGVAPFAVVLTHCPPLSLAEVGPPLFPGDILLPCFIESFSLCGHEISPSWCDLTICVDGSQPSVLSFLLISPVKKNISCLFVACKDHIFLFSRGGFRKKFQVPMFGLAGTAFGTINTDAASGDLKEAVQGILSNFPPR